MRVRIIANPIAGGGRGKTFGHALEQALQGKVDAVELHLTTHAGDGKDAAARPGADCLVAVGGDGSLNEVLNGMPDLSLPVALLPVGTANVVARELELPSDPEFVANLIAERKMISMDVGLCGERRFLLGAGAGYDAAVVAAVSEQRGKKSSKAKWVVPGVKTALTYRFPKIQVTIDGEIVTDAAQYVVVGNCRYSAGAFAATPKARIDDGLFGVCMFHDLGFRKLVALSLAVWSPQFINRPDVLYRTGKEVSLVPAEEEAAPLQIDGDPEATIPATFTIHEQKLSIFTPRAS
jgi:diacylglycerol kinase (ATP)